MRTTFAHAPKIVSKQFFIEIDSHYCLNVTVMPSPISAIDAIVAENNIRRDAGALPVPNMTTATFACHD
jgi:hypothetical protein